MKIRLIVTVVALIVVYGLLIGTGSLANQEPQQARPSFTVSTQGTLLELFNADGTSLTKKVVGDGFKLDYKTRGQMRSASAIGTETKGLLTSSEPAKLDGNTATAIGQTVDKALEITSNLTFDASAGELIIKRKFRNISQYSVTLQTIQNSLDSQVMVRGGALPAADLVSASMRQITAGLSPHDCGTGACPVGPPCPFPPGCPPIPFPGYYRAGLYPSIKEVLLGWFKQITLKPKQNQQPAGEASIVIRVVIK